MDKDVYFSNFYDLKDIFLIEVPLNYMDDFNASKNNLKLKGNDNLSVICTDSKSYELKYVYSTNSFYLLENNPTKMNVSVILDHTLEVTDYHPKRSHIYKMLKQNSLKYNKFNGATNYDSKKINNIDLRKIKFNDYLNNSDMNRVLLSQSLENFNAFEKNNFIFILDDEFIIDYLRDILFLIVDKKLNIKDLDFSFIFKCLEEKFPELILSTCEKNSLINEICDININRAILCNLKVKLFCVKSIFYSKNNEKKNLYLKEFIQLLNGIYRLIFQSEIMDSIIEEEIKYQITSCQDNLFEYYKEFDLRFLRGHYTVNLLGSQKEPIIMSVDQNGLSEKFEIRLSELFLIKDRWQTSELIHFFPIEYNFNKEEKIQKYCKIISDINPFDSKKTVYYYMLKNKISF